MEIKKTMKEISGRKHSQPLIGDWISHFISPQSLPGRLNEQPPSLPAMVHLILIAHKKKKADPSTLLK